ncbi:hypothetical protein EDB19DRAFT_1901553 [Suillus lakei]|nr:hypothetical protein EDB19DRAFT_1901553 [Suillus lakei]
MSLAHELVLEIFKYVYDDSIRCSFPNLVQLNWAYSDLTLTVLWAELNSLEPLLHLMPEDVVERHSVDGQWRYTIHRAPSALQLEWFYIYAPLIRAIKSFGPSINYDIIDGFTNILHCHTLASLSPLLLHLNRLELTYSRDPLLQFIPHIIHGGVRSLILPHRGILVGSVVSHLLQTTPPLQSLVYMSLDESTNDFARNIHLFPSLHDLTIPLLEASDMQIVVSHPSLQNLTLYIFYVLPLLQTITFSHPLCLLSFVFRGSFAADELARDSWDIVMTTLCQFPAPCRQLSIDLSCMSNGNALCNCLQLLADEPNLLHDTIFSPSNLMHIHVHANTILFSVPLPRNFLQPLYRLLLTHVDLASFNMCYLDDDDLYVLSDAMPQLQSLFLGTLSYWKTPPRASLSGVATVLRNCPVLIGLGLVFSCSLGQLDFEFLPVNRSITILNVRVSPPYNNHAVAYFLSRSLPNLCRTYIEPRQLRVHQYNHILHDRLLHFKGW